MKRDDKKQHLNNIENIFIQFKSFIIVNFQHMTAGDFLCLRKELKTASCGLIVTKNSLACIALEKLGKEELKSKFINSIFVVYSNDIIVISKIIVNFISNNKNKISLVCAYDNSQMLSRDKVVYLSNLPSLKELHMRIANLISYNIPVRLALCLKALGDKN
ncbi:50S ribosomal protein L10 [Neoehrlichia mikurensis]|uniref:50S ribosomal protein L10 n=1 Tax=Neoehrlichia mikurensis TaxID=89586 RepID=A0A9Q9BW93_9RICK|nr:50S ribosomal protein L10 [Neoehrlichia mikurensis]QXK92167.1 50S ribosomal protein L10 [Neoehrlichia mikurensis]QXK92622.1 50S ribosomal protein L10 [Neoehrlichia mikurensis]QXK93861.1 50S ribosomal protein L10 [Neoehrlichia mikurensis]UTO55141.1 50S ribosomal protein L10 [Neoehrlichia mikurensis]UTO56062.1 50S ribosomal protein L10 [Neoehrlichia mikurensis]